YQLASVLPVVSLALVNAWMPGFFATAGTEAGRRDFARTGTQVLALVWATCALLLVFAPELAGVILTEGYGEASLIIRLVGVGLAFHGMQRALLLPILFSGRTGWVSAVTGGAFAVNVALNLVFVPRHGMVAAAWVTVASYAL